ncbi:MAG TPA: hypothetical protein VMV91_03970 [Rhodocyclaceae bacterium]|nr:hypothetical protein [Rhodocyclaceae bacterium]
MALKEHISRHGDAGDCRHALWPDPEGVVGAPHIEPGMTVVDLGCGDGYFSAAVSLRGDFQEGGRVRKTGMKGALKDTAAHLSTRDRLVKVDYVGYPADEVLDVLFGARWKEIG